MCTICDKCDMFRSKSELSSQHHSACYLFISETYFCVVINFSCVLEIDKRDTSPSKTKTTGELTRPYPDQEGNKLQRQKILIFIYPIYNHNWRNISTIYIYKKTSIKRNILTIKQNTGVLISP
jgi:hypothetical protein